MPFSHFTWKQLAVPGLVVSVHMQFAVQAVLQATTNRFAAAQRQSCQQAKTALVCKTYRKCFAWLGTIVQPSFIHVVDVVQLVSQVSNDLTNNCACYVKTFQVC